MAVALVALRKVGEHEQPGSGLGGYPAGLPGGQVPVLAGERGVGLREGGFADQHVRLVGEFERPVAEPGIHDEREPLARSRLADLLQAHQAVRRPQAAVALQAADIGSGNASRREPVRQHPPPVRLHQPVSEGGHAVGQPTSLEAEGRRLADRAVAADRPFRQSQCVVLVQRRIAQPLEDLAVLGRVMGLDLVRHLVERQPLEYAGQAEAVVAVEMSDADAADLARRDAGELHLALRSLARIEQDSVGFPPEQVAVVVAATGRHLARSAENHEFPVGHGTDLTPARPRAVRPPRGAAPGHGKWTREAPPEFSKV